MVAGGERNRPAKNREKLPMCDGRLDGDGRGGYGMSGGG